MIMNYSSLHMTHNSETTFKKKKKKLYIAICRICLFDLMWLRQKPLKKKSTVIQILTDGPCAPGEPGAPLAP